MTAEDYAYSLRRILDPAIKSPWLWLLEDKIVGAHEAHANAAKTDRFDYDPPVAGLEVVDRYTLKIRLNVPDLRFLYVLAVPSTAAIAREVVEAYGNDIGGHPVGTGPYMLGHYRRSDRIVLLQSPNYREVMYSPAGPVPAPLQPIATALKGKRLPLVPNVEITIMEEGGARWLAFLSDESDLLLSLPVQFAGEALVTGNLKPELAARGIVHQAFIPPELAYIVFNMDDAVVGGYSPEKIALGGLSAWLTTSPKRSASSTTSARSPREVPSRPTLRATTPI